MIAPSEITASKGSTVHIQCTVNTAANYSWIKNGTVLPSSHSAFQMTHGMLVLVNVSEIDSGQYTCIGAAGTTILASSATLSIGGKNSFNNFNVVTFFLHIMKQGFS